MDEDIQCHAGSSYKELGAQPINSCDLIENLEESNRTVSEGIDSILCSILDSCLKMFTHNRISKSDFRFLGIQEAANARFMSMFFFYACRKLAAHATQQKQEKEGEQEQLMLQKAKELEAFDQQNHGAVPQYNDRNHNLDKNGFHGANSVKVTSYEEEALRTMKAFWLPSATPGAPAKVDAPDTCTVCPEGNEKLKLKTLFPIHFTEDTSEKKKSNSLDKTYICPSCKVTMTNAMSLVALSSCGHVFCKKCADKFVAVDKVCVLCSKACKERHLVNLAKGGTGFAGHGDSLEAKDFKHLGSGSGLGLVRPAVKT